MAGLSSRSSHSHTHHFDIILHVLFLPLPLSLIKTTNLFCKPPVILQVDNLHVLLTSSSSSLHIHLSTAV